MRGQVDMVYIVITAMIIIGVGLYVMNTYYKRANRFNGEDTVKDITSIIESMCDNLREENMVEDTVTFSYKIRRDDFIDEIKNICFPGVARDSIEISGCGLPPPDRFGIAYCGPEILLGDKEIIMRIERYENSYGIRVDVS